MKEVIFLEETLIALLLLLSIIDQGGCASL